MKKSAVLLTAVCISVQSAAFAGTQIGLKYDNTDLISSEAPFRANDVVMLPLRAVMEKLGFKVFYNDETEEVHMLKDARHASVKIGSTVAYVNGQAVELERTAITLNGTAMVPARFVSLASEKYVGWNVEENSVVLSEKLTSDGIDLTKVVKIADNELLKNSDFEITDTDSDDFGWKKYGYGAMSIHEENPYFGENCILVGSRTSCYSGISQDVRDILNANGPGKYIISAYIRTDEDSPSIKKSYSLLLRTQGSGDEKKKYAKSSISISDEWTKLVLEANLSWSGTLTDGLLYFEGGDKTDLCNYYIDMCSMVKSE